MSRIDFIINAKNNYKNLQLIPMSIWRSECLTDGDKSGKVCHIPKWQQKDNIQKLDPSIWYNAENIALKTGIDSNILVLDIDNKSDPNKEIVNGMDVLAGWLSERLGIDSDDPFFTNKCFQIRCLFLITSKYTFIQKYQKLVFKEHRIKLISIYFLS